MKHSEHADSKDGNPGEELRQTSSVHSVPVLDTHIFNPDQEPPADQAYFEGLVSAEDLVVWLGREKHRKTNVILQFSMCAATGRDFLGFRFAAPGPLKVLIVDYETKTNSLWQRYHAILKAMELSEEERRRLRENLKIIEVRKLLRAGGEFPRIPVNNAKANDPDKLAENFWRQLVQDYPAQIYVLDPMRSIHGLDENDSLIEALLSRLRRLFGKAAVIVAHHMRKTFPAGREITLQSDMRLWSDGARGSGAIKAHADVIVCQERTMEENSTEVIYVGAFLKDGPDIEPLRLQESDSQSFLWVATLDVPGHLKTATAALQKNGGVFVAYKGAADVLLGVGLTKPTVYRQLNELRQRHLLIQAEGGWRLNVSLPFVSNEPEDFVSARGKKAKQGQEW